MLLSKNRIIRRRAVVGLLVLAALALLSLSYRQGSTGVVGDIQRGTSSVTAPLTTAANRVTQPFADAWNWTRGLINARNENARLRRYQQQYSALLTKWRVAQGQLTSESALLQFKSQNSVAKQFPSAAASVIQQPADVYDGTVVIDAGTSSGLAVNDPVIAPGSSGGGALIGVVSACAASTCDVRLITDQRIGSAVTARVIGTSAQGSLVPSSGAPGLLSLELVANSIPLHNTQEVVTAGTRSSRLQALLPAGLPIGRISSVQTTDYSNGGYHEIQVTPFVDFSNLSTVLVLKVPHA
jgi:rod shape-determining protein MreC